MRKGLTQSAQQPFYLWLLGIYPIIHLYSLNLGLVVDREVLGSLAVVLAATTVAFFLINHFVRDRHKTALALSVASACFSFSGHLYTQAFMPKSLFVWTLMISAVALLIMFGIVRKGSRKVLPRLATPLNLIMLALLISPSFAVASGLLNAASFDASTLGIDAPLRADQQSPKVNDSEARPDIYYIIPDAYPSDAHLLDTMSFDNSAFTQALRDRGFVVIPHAQSNYGSTLQCRWPPTLNLRYYRSRIPRQLDDNLEYMRVANRRK